MSATQRRQQRQRQRKNKVAQLSLTSLMDIFTILVFFLLVSAQNPVQLPSMKNLSLPLSSSDALSDNSLKIVVSRQQLLINDKPIMSLNSNDSTARNDFSALANALALQRPNYKPNVVLNGAPAWNVIILGDQNVSYAVLRDIMRVCSEQQFAHISFAVLREKANAAPTS